MWTVIFMITTIVFVVKWYAEKIKFKAVIYYIVDKEYTAPSRYDLEQYISIVARKTAEDIFNG